ncbi:hypothetical protein F5Y03DRAFT_407390 [Xylaria venustula]|nr:hypothetical protein F5Y03DRAFT_407390 [Xylaria venustula]
MKCLNKHERGNHQFTATVYTMHSRSSNKAGNGSRARSDQRAFKEHILKDYNLEPDKHDKLKRGLEWSVTHRNWVVKDFLTAAHIFPASWGQKLMTEIFGEECGNELFSSRNGLLLPKSIKRAMDEWAIVIVPDIRNDPTIDEVKPWLETSPKGYKFRVLDPNHPELNRQLSSSDNDMRFGTDLDESPLVFRGDFRPRARFLWLWFACAVLKRFWSTPLEDAPDNLSPQFGKGMWATAGAYVKRDFVLGIMKEIGHGVADFILEGAKPKVEEDDNVPNKAVAAMVASQVVETSEKDEDDEDDEEAKDEEEEEDDGDDEDWDDELQKDI